MNLLGINLWWMLLAGSALTNAVILAVHTEVLEALLQCWVCFRACVQTAQAECICQASSCGHCSC